MAMPISVPPTPAMGIPLTTPAHGVSAVNPSTPLPPLSASAPTPPSGIRAEDASIVSLEENEKRYLENVLRSLGGRVEDAAKALGLPRSSLYHKIKRLGIRPSKP
ncbi:MAG: hypothetical protein JST92_13125 [Deltaproteobacteria bacterium]|nr:hypothetical protein [Deltaproteobacteria bacterium]